MLALPTPVQTGLAQLPAKTCHLPHWMLLLAAHAPAALALPMLRPLVAQVRRFDHFVPHPTYPNQLHVC
jgi:hypothetical protein